MDLANFLKKPRFSGALHPQIWFSGFSSLICYRLCQCQNMCQGITCVYDLFGCYQVKYAKKGSKFKMSLLLAFSLLQGCPVSSVKLAFHLSVRVGLPCWGRSLLLWSIFQIVSTLLWQNLVRNFSLTKLINQCRSQIFQIRKSKRVTRCLLYYVKCIL